MNSANNVAKWKTGFIRHKKGIGPIFISEFADLFAAAHMYATRTYFFRMIHNFSYIILGTVSIPHAGLCG